MAPPARVVFGLITLWELLTLFINFTNEVQEIGFNRASFASSAQPNSQPQQIPKTIELTAQLAFKFGNTVQGFGNIPEYLQIPSIYKTTTINKPDVAENIVTYSGKILAAFTLLYLNIY